MHRTRQVLWVSSWIFLGLAAGCGGGSSGGKGGQGGAAGTGGHAGGGAAGTAGRGGTGGSAGVIGTAGRGGSGGGSAGTGGSAGATGGAGGAAGTGGAAGRGGTGGATAGTGGAGTGGSAGGAGTGGSAGGTGTGGVSCNLPPTDGGAGTGGVLPDSVTFVANVTVTTLSGSGTSGAMNGAASVATFDNPVNVAIGPAGALVVADFENSLIRGVTTDGTASTLTQQSSFNRPFGLAFAGSTLYAQTDSNASGVHTSTTGTVWRIDTGTGIATMVATNLGRPRGIAALSDGRLALADFPNQRVRLLDPTSGNATDLAGQMGCPGSATGTGSSARFVEPYGVAVLTGDRIIVSDASAHLLREVSLAGVVTDFAGDGIAGTIDGPRASARFVNPRALAADGSGAIFVSDTGAHRIRRIAADGTVATVAGDGVAGYMEGAGNAAEFFGQEGVAASWDGLTVYVADGTAGGEPPGPYNRIRKIAIAP